MSVRIICGDCREVLTTLPDASVNCIVTSPPYFNLRDYQVDGQIGMEKTPSEFIAVMVAVFREALRVLRDDGTAWVVIGDSYASGKGTCFNPGGGPKSYIQEKQRYPLDRGNKSTLARAGLKPKDLIGIPWMLAFALRDDGWYLRSDIIWCLSGGTWLYARTKKGDMPIMVRDLARLKRGTVKLWNGEKWTPLLGMSKSHRRGNEIEIVLRSGERISCTPGHRFPTQRGLLLAGELTPGDVLTSCQLPEPYPRKDCAIDEDAAWLAGLYIAEGSMAGDTIQIAGHAKEEARWARLQIIAGKYGGTATRTVKGNCMNIRLYGKVLCALLNELVTGRTAHDKGFAPVVWRYSNAFVASMLDGYLSGDGHRDSNRWRLGFCRNYNLERDLRTACARLGYSLTLNLSSVPYDGRMVPTFRGELRKERSGHHNERSRNEVMEIRKARCREVCDIGVDDEPHTYALASGILTHNSKPNPMPESVTDRCTKAHEYIFLLSKSERYYFDQEAIAEPAIYGDNGSAFDGEYDTATRRGIGKKRRKTVARGNFNGKTHAFTGREAFRAIKDTRNKRDVWTVATEPYSGAHFATFPTTLIRPCILAGCPRGGVVLDPFAGSGTTGEVCEEEGRNSILIELNPAYVTLAHHRTAQQGLFAGRAR